MAESFEEAGCRICRQKAGRDALPGDPSLLSRKHLFRLRLWSFSEYLHPKNPIQRNSSWQSRETTLF